MPDGYLALDLWMALGLDDNLFDDYYSRNDWANTWSALLNAVREQHLERCDFVTEEGRCVLFKHAENHVHYTAEDVGSSEPLPFEPKEESNLVNHAKRELEIIGEEPEFVKGYLKLIQAFADMGHSGGSASVAIPVINELLQFKNLSPLTDNPDEWFFHGPEMWDGENGVWQNIRNGEAFSNDGGKTYYLLSEGANDQNRKPMHDSERVVPS